MELVIKCFIFAVMAVQILGILYKSPSIFSNNSRGIVGLNLIRVFSIVIGVLWLLFARLDWNDPRAFIPTFFLWIVVLLQTFPRLRSIGK
jgi:hypothetical protein